MLSTLRHRVYDVCKRLSGLCGWTQHRIVVHNLWKALKAIAKQYTMYIIHLLYANQAELKFASS